MKSFYSKLTIINFFIFAFTLSTVSRDFVYQIDASNALVTSCEIDYGDLTDCFDGNTNTIVRTKNINPAFVKFVFPVATSIDSVAVYVGQDNLNIDRDLWWVEAADNESDLNSKSGTYVLAVDSGQTAGLGWDARLFNITISKKIWKFNIKRIIGDNYVHIVELAFYSFSAQEGFNFKIPMLSEMKANNIIINNNINQPPNKFIDGNLNTGLSFSGQSNARLLFALRKEYSFNKVYTFFSAQCKWYIEYASSFEDLKNKTGTYQKTLTRDYKSNSKDSIVFSTPIKPKHIQLRVTDFEEGFFINEIEFISDISNDKLTGLQYDLELWKGWKWKNVQNYLIYNSLFNVPKASCKWSSSNTSVAIVDSTGIITAVASGYAVITASYLDSKCSIYLRVIEPVKSIEKEILNNFMANPMKDCFNTLPILIIQYMPTTDGENINPSYSPNYYDLNSRTIQFEKNKFLESIQRIKFALEEGSCFRKFKNFNSKPNIGIKVVDYLTIYEPMPPSIINPFYDNGILKHTFDFERLATQINLKDYIENKGVKYVIIMDNGTNAFMPAYNPDKIRPEQFIGFFESYASANTQYKPCNGINPEPLPLYNNSYFVINQFMALPGFNSSNFEPFTHHFEAIWSDVNKSQDGNTNLFWNSFVGSDEGRCGWTHMPPNTRINYGYFHYIQIDSTRVKPVLSDNEDWKPDNSGEKKFISHHSWEDINYNWPDGISNFENRFELQWFIYWLQCIPGNNNMIPYKKSGIDYEISNWWKFVYDWDYSINNEPGLYEIQKRIFINDMPNEFCSGQEFRMKYSKQGNFNGYSNFSVQLSDSNGSFSNYMLIGTSNSLNSNEINAAIPKNINSGSRYRIRIVSDNPLFIGIDNGFDLKIFKIPVSTIRGQQNSCKNSLQTFERVNSDGNFYKWKVINGSIIGSDTNKILDVLWHNENIGNVILYSYNSSNCMDSATLTINLYKVISPVINGDNKVCQNSKSNYYTKNDSLSNYETIKWIVENGQILGTDQSDKLRVKWNNTGEGKITLTVINKSGCADTASLKILITKPPLTSISGSQRACFAQESRYSASNNAKTNNYWFIENGIISLDLNDSIFIKWNKTGIGKIKLKQQLLESGCVDSTELEIMVYDSPQKPVIIKSDNKLVSSSEIGNQWFLNSKLLIDSTNQIIYPSLYGFYQVRIAKNDCYSELSDKVNFEPINVDFSENTKKINIYPNPADNFVIIRDTEGDVEIINIFGITIWKGFVEINQRLDISTIEKGMYFIRFKNKENEISNFKFIKM